jgi:hypothetical protein
MTTEPLSLLATFHICREIEVDRQEVVSIFARQNTRKLYKNFYVFYYRIQDTCSDYHVSAKLLLYRTVF